MPSSLRSITFFLKPVFSEHNSPRAYGSDENAQTYLFNKHLIKHRFCPTCGIHPYGEGTTPKGNHMVAINIRCLEDFDISSVPVTYFDGKSI